MTMDHYPIRLDRDLRVQEPQALYQAVGEELQSQGFEVRGSSPPPNGGLHAVRDVLLDEARRRQGFWMLGGGVAITLAVFLVIILEVTDNRFAVSAPLLVAVILGGLGLGRIAEPGKRIRYVVDVQMQGGARQMPPSAPGADIQVTVRAGAGHPQGEAAVSEWLAGDRGRQGLDEARLDEVFERFAMSAP